jgi:hypothetical protein
MMQKKGAKPVVWVYTLFYDAPSSDVVFSAAVVDDSRSR